MSKTRWMLLAAVAAVVAGCSQRTINSANSDANHDVAVVTHAADQAAKEVKPEVQKAALAARVTTALEAAGIHGIRVDGAPDGVTLVGQVKAQSDKQRAVQVAQETLGKGKSVHSRLTVSSGS